MKSLKLIPEHVDEVAGALYEDNVDKFAEYLDEVKSCALQALKLVELPWDTSRSAAIQQEAEDKFTTWTRTWKKVMDEVSKSIDGAKD